MWSVIGWKLLLPSTLFCTLYWQCVYCCLWTTVPFSCSTWFCSFLCLRIQWKHIYCIHIDYYRCILHTHTHTHTLYTVTGVVHCLFLFVPCSHVIVESYTIMFLWSICSYTFYSLFVGIHLVFLLLPLDSTTDLILNLNWFYTFIYHSHTRYLLPAPPCQLDSSVITLLCRYYTCRSLLYTHTCTTLNSWWLLHLTLQLPRLYHTLFLLRWVPLMQWTTWLPCYIYTLVPVPVYLCYLFCHGHSERWNSWCCDFIEFLPALPVYRGPCHVIHHPIGWTDVLMPGSSVVIATAVPHLSPFSDMPGCYTGDDCDCLLPSTFCHCCSRCVCHSAATLTHIPHMPNSCLCPLINVVAFCVLCHTRDPTLLPGNCCTLYTFVLCLQFVGYLVTLA